MITLLSDNYHRAVSIITPHQDSYFMQRFLSDWRPLCLGALPPSKPTVSKVGPARPPPRGQLSLVVFACPFPCQAAGRKGVRVCFGHTAASRSAARRRRASPKQHGSFERTLELRTAPMAWIFNVIVEQQERKWAEKIILRIIFSPPKKNGRQRVQFNRSFAECRSFSLRHDRFGLLWKNHSFV